MWKVINQFEDKITGKRYNVGDTYDGTDARCKELHGKGKVVQVEDIPVKKSNKKTK